MRKLILCWFFLLACLGSTSYAQETVKEKWEISLEAGLRKIASAKINQHNSFDSEMPALLESRNAYAGAVLANYRFDRNWGLQTGLRVANTKIHYNLKRFFPEQYIFYINVSEDVVSLELPIQVTYDVKFNLANRPNALRLSVGPVLTHHLSAYRGRRNSSYSFSGDFLAPPPSSSTHAGNVEGIYSATGFLFGYEAKVQLNSILGSRWGLGVSYQQILSKGSIEQYKYRYYLDYINHSGGTTFTEIQDGQFFASKTSLWMLSVNYILFSPSLNEGENKGHQGTPRYQQY